MKSIEEKDERKTERKTDRRTIYTRNVIKESLLRLLEKNSFEKVNVAMLCREAGITRATFYLHYNNFTEVLDELLEEAFLIADTDSVADDGKILSKLAKENNLEEFKKYAYLLPVCQRIADSSRYRVLFMDETLSYYILKKMYQKEKDYMLPVLMEERKLTYEEADMIFRFMLYDSFSVNKELKWEKNDRWYRFQQLLINFVQGGIDNL